MGQSKLLVALVMISVFAISILGYSIGFANDNGAVISAEDNQNVTTLNSQLQSHGEEVYLQFNETDGAFDRATISVGGENLEAGRPFKDTLKTSRKGVGYSMGLVRSQIFGGSNSQFLIIFRMFFAVLIALAIFVGYKLWKGGNPD